MQFNVSKVSECKYVEYFTYCSHCTQTQTDCSSPTPADPLRSPEYNIFVCFRVVEHLSEGLRPTDAHKLTWEDSANGKGNTIAGRQPKEQRGQNKFQGKR